MHKKASPQAPRRDLDLTQLANVTAGTGVTSIGIIPPGADEKGKPHK